MNVKIISVIALSFFIAKGSFADVPLRDDFKNWQETYKTLDKSAQKKLLDTLKTYPLYPYAQSQYFSANFDTTTPNEINHFVIENKGFPATSNLVQQYLAYLVKNKEWAKIKALNIDSSLSSRCSYQYALFKLGETKKAFDQIKDIWLTGKSLPTTCDVLLDEWAKTPQKTANIVMLRIELALENRNIGLARHLTNQLPDTYKTLKKNLLSLYSSPKALVDFSRNIHPSRFTKKVVMNSFSQLVNVDSEQALKSLPNFAKQQKLSQTEQLDLQRMIANSYFNDKATEAQIKWRDEFIAKHGSTSQIERQIRQAIRKNNLTDVATWIALLPESDKQKDEWQYWQAAILQDKNEKTKANAILEKLAKSRGFYGMYSAQKLNQTYPYKFDYSVTNAASKEQEKTLLNAKYQNNPVIVRVNELNYWGMLSEANREWNNLVYSEKDTQTQAELARFAYNQNWGTQSIQATIAGRLWDNWLERFPVDYKDAYTKALADKSITLPYSLAITRQESALNPVAQSYAGAKGLMQLMPATAKETAKKNNVPYSSSADLYDPQINIMLGTAYLESAYQVFDQNRILASAAYNAGPNRAKRWLAESNGQLSDIAFIESIPFTETRNYVKNVLVYDYIYHLILGEKSDGLLTKSELGKKY